MKRETNHTPVLKAFMERSSEAGDVTPANDAETLQFDAETLRGEEKMLFSFLDIISTVEKLHLVRLRTLPNRKCIWSCVGSDIIFIMGNPGWESRAGIRVNDDHVDFIQTRFKITIIITICCISNCRGEQE